MAARGGGSARTREGPEGCPPQSSSDPSLVRPKVSISVMRAALASAGVPTAGLLERAEFEALYWKLQEGEEITYDYMFALDEADKVPCSCGARCCRGWMN